MQKTVAPNARAEQAALKYARARYRVLAVYGLRADGKTCACRLGAKCPTPGKHPVEVAWQKAATTDEEQIRKLFARWPNAHVGVMPPDGCVIIDVDPRNNGDKTLRKLLNGTKLPKTPTQRSGGGGVHLVFRGDVTGKLGEGIDIKRYGRGYVVAWPSGHTSGGRYTWKPGLAPWEIKPAPLPAPLQGGKPAEPPEDAALPLERTSPEPTTVPLETVRAALAHVSADDYHRWVNFGQALRYNYGAEGEEVWLEWSRTSSKWKDGDAEKWSTFDKNRDRPLLTIRSIMSVARRSGYRPLATEFDKGLWALGDITGFLRTAPPALDFVFEPCIAAGKVTVLAGAGGSSKSFFALTLASRLAICKECGPLRPGKSGKSLVLVAEENREDVHRRMHAICRANGYTDAEAEVIEREVGVLPLAGTDWRLLYRDEGGDLHESERVQYLIDEVRAVGLRLLVLDPMVTFNGGHENDNAEMARLMFALGRIAEKTGAAVLVLHHVNKAGQTSTLSEITQAIVRGATAVVDNARAALLLARIPRSDAPLYGLPEQQAGRYVVLRALKSNLGPHIDDVIFGVEPNGSLRVAPEVHRMPTTVREAREVVSDRQREIAILRLLRDNEEITQTELATRVFTSQSKVSRTLQNLHERGLVNRIGVGAGTSYELTKKGRKAVPIDPETDLKDLF